MVYQILRIRNNDQYNNFKSNIIVIYAYFV